jgi:hypothetical protein
MKIRGQAWSKLASVSTMGSSRDARDICLARRLADAVAAGDRDEAIRLTRGLERALTNTPYPSAHAAPSFTAQPAVDPMTYTPTPSRGARQVVADALAEIGVACRAQVATDYAEAQFGPRVETPDASGFLQRADNDRHGRLSTATPWERRVTTPRSPRPSEEPEWQSPPAALLGIWLSSNRPKHCLWRT